MPSRWVRVSLGVTIALWLAVPAAGEPRLIEGVDYAAAGDPAQTLDLFLPDAEATGGAAPPLLVFVHSRFWSQRERGRDIAHRFARPLQRAGAAVAIVRHRLAPDHPHPAGARDVAAAVAWLFAAADEHGYDPSRVFLAGHGSGGHLAALVTLDPRYLSAHGLAPDRIAGLAVWSGTFDLRAGGEAMAPLYAEAFGGEAERREASPIEYAEYADADAEPDRRLFLLMVAQHDLPDAAAQATAFAEALRQGGHPLSEMFFLQGRDHWSGLSLSEEDSPARHHVWGLLELPGAEVDLAEAFATRSYWRDPSYSTLPFWEDESLVRVHDADDWLRVTLNMPFARPGRPELLHPERYAAVDLFDWIRARVPGGDGDWRYLTLTNVRGEQVVWSREEIEPLAPRIVVGIDEERQLFRLTDVYHTNRRYSWKGEAETWILGRPLGAFIHFPERPPEGVDPKLFGRFGLEADAFRVSREDPLAPLRSLPPREEAIVTEELRCVSCHQLRGVGGRAGHLRARDGALVGGFGLPLEEYPPAVWRRYCFEQEELAAEIGATPVPLDAHANALFELVERERGR